MKYVLSMSKDAIFRAIYGVMRKRVVARPLYRPKKPPSRKIYLPVPSIDGLYDCESAKSIDSLVLIRSSGYVSVLDVMPVSPPQHSLAKLLELSPLNRLIL